MEIKKILVNGEYIDFCTEIDLKEIEDNDYSLLNEDTVDLSNVIDNVSMVNDGDDLNG